MEGRGQRGRVQEERGEEDGREFGEMMTQARCWILAT